MRRAVPHIIYPHHMAQCLFFLLRKRKSAQPCGAHTPAPSSASRSTPATALSLMDAGAVPLLAALLVGVKGDANATTAKALKEALSALASLSSHELLRAALLGAVHADYITAVTSIEGIADTAVQAALLLVRGHTRADSKR